MKPAPVRQHSGYKAVRKIWKVLRWIIGVFIIIFSIAGFQLGEITIAIISLLLGLGILPIRYLKKRGEKRKEGSEQLKHDRINQKQKSPPYVNQHKKTEPVMKPSLRDFSDKNTITTQIVQSVLTKKAEIGTGSEPTTLSNKNLSYNAHDGSVIDVTGQGYKLPPPVPIGIKSQPEVVPWPHQYIYSYDALDSASSEQKTFYVHFKSSFHQKEYLDLKDYNNYAFVLLFHLLQAFDSATTDAARSEIEKELQALGEHYPRTASYAKSFLLERMYAIGDREGILRLGGGRSSYNSPSYDDWYIGNKYAAKLLLNKEQIALLNTINYSGGNFESIEDCFIEILKLFNKVAADLNSKLIESGSSLSANLDELADIAARKNKHYTKGSDNYKWFVGYHKTELYLYIMKRCDNAVREVYRYSRTKNTDCSYTNKEAVAAFIERLDQPVTAALQLLKASIQPPDSKTEIELNAQSTTRWKEPFEVLIAGLTKSNADERSKQVEALAVLNAKNPSVENIYYEAAKIFAPIERQGAITFYLKYVQADLASTRVNAKPLTKTALKHLFSNAGEEAAFQEIIANLQTDKILENAIRKSAAIFEARRKKIQLDKDAIAQVKTQHSGTVDILNEVLKDEEDQTSVILKPLAQASEILQPSNDAMVDTPLKQSVGLSFNPAQQELLTVFATNDFLLTEEALSIFAKTKSMFKNGLVDSLNEQCYELLDDVLIEESDDGYQMNSDYYYKLTA